MTRTGSSTGRSTAPPRPVLLERGRALHMPGTPQGRSRLALTIVTSLTRKMALVRGPSAASVLFSPGQVRSRPASVASRRARLTPRGRDATRRSLSRCIPPKTPEPRPIGVP